MNRQGLLGEYIGKGFALGLLAVLAARQPTIPASLLFAGCTLAGLVLALLFAAWRNRGLHRPGQRSAYILFLLLEYPALLHLGILGGMFAAAIFLRVGGYWTAEDLYLAFGVGLGIGLLFAGLRLVRLRWVRRGVVLALGIAATASLVWTLEQYTDTYNALEQTVFALTLLAVLPVLYLLTFTGQAEETELEIGTVCVALGVALWLLVPPTARLMALAFPLMLYFFYVGLYLQRLRTFKHVLRGMSHARLGQVGHALVAYRRALRYSPADRLANEQFWRLHRDLNLASFQDPEIVELVDINLCLERARELLLSGSPPSPERIEDALKLLTLVVEQRPNALPAVNYWRAVAHTHRGEYDKASSDLRAILDETATTPDQEAYRQTILVASWQLALTQHPELEKRVGKQLLREPKHRFAAIAAVEAALVRDARDEAALELKPVLYGGLTWADYLAEAGDEALHAASAFDHAYCASTAAPFLADPEQWRHGLALLRISARGLPQQGPALLRQAAQAAQEHGDQALAKELQTQLVALARQLGVKELTPEAREAYFAVVKQAGEQAFQAGHLHEAIHFFTLSMESEASGQDTVRMLTDLYEQLEDVPNALFFNERCLMYDGSNPAYLERKDRYYYSLQPEQYAEHAERLSRVFDLGYCTGKAKKLLDAKHSGPEQVDWALHLARLALAVDPENITALVQAARAHLRRGESEEALPLLEKARAGKVHIKTGDDQESWYLCCRLLGDLYLQAGQPAQALASLKDFRASARSGADTIFKMAQAMEQLGDRVKAIKLYENVTTYEGHPLVGEARSAKDRLTALAE